MNPNTPLRYGSFLLFPAAAAVILVSLKTPINPWTFLVGATGIFTAMLLLTRLCRDNTSFLFAILLALLVRVVFVAWYPAAGEINHPIRVEGIQQHDRNFFNTSPDSQASQASAPSPESIRQGIGTQDPAGISWPFSQLLLQTAAVISPEEHHSRKLIVTLFDVASIGILILMVRQRKQPLRYVLLYALNPLVLIAASGRGETEAVAATLILAAVALGEGRGFRPLAYAALSCAILTRISAVILLPFWLRALGMRRLVFLVLPLLLFIPYPIDISTFFRTSPALADSSTATGLFSALLHGIFGFEQDTTLLILTAILGATLATFFFLTPSLLKASCSALGVMLLCLPTVPPWSFILLTPFLVFFHQWSWLGLHLTSLPLILYLDPTISPQLFTDRPLLLSCAYLPFLVLAACAWFSRKDRWPADYPAPEQLSVIVPVRNEADGISACLDSLRAQDFPCEIIVVDGGSTDQTLERVSAHPKVRSCHAAPGRGTQIARGVDEASGDIILVLHADSRLQPDSLQRMMSALRHHPGAAGGAMAVTYDPPSLRFRLIALLNNLRARLTGITFGDQAQFFRRAALPEGFPDYRLMEDVELSMRLKEHGSILFMPDGVRSSTRRWNTTGYFTNSLTVIRLTGSFLVMRAFGLIHDKGEWFYQQYYRQVK
jgi:rSAM/selenodomain-associated transferase 2